MKVWGSRSSPNLRNRRGTIGSDFKRKTFISLWKLDCIAARIIVGDKLDHHFNSWGEVIKGGKSKSIKMKSDPKYIWEETKALCLWVGCGMGKNHIKDGPRFAQRI